MTSPDTCNDGWFGPVVGTTACRGGFDFTVVFEASVMAIVPAACFLLVAPIRIVLLSRQSPKVQSSAIRVAILVLAAFLAAIQILLLSLVATQHAAGKLVSLAGAILEVVAALGVVVLIDLEYIRSIRPSFLVSAYLFVTLILDLARVRTAWLLPDCRAYSICLSLSLAIKLVLLSLGNVEKRKWLAPTEKTRSDESVSGPINRGLFVWLNGLLWTGYSELLTGDTLPSIYEKLSSGGLYTRFTDCWAHSNQNGQNALLLAVVKCLGWEIAGIAFPRLCVVGFSIAQPFLVGRVVTMLQQTDEPSLGIGYGLIGATVMVFIGIAVSRSSYQHLGYRTTTMLRGGLMALVYQHMMNLPPGSTEESSAMSLMGSDIEMLAEYFQSTVCETWANVVQLGLAIWLLKTQVGAVCIAPVVVVIVFTVLSLGMGKAVTTRQKTWLQAMEKRINFTTVVLESIRNVKLLGLSEVMATMINGLRVDELNISKKFRRVQTVRVCMMNLPPIVGQLSTFAGYAIVAKAQRSGNLSLSQAITSLSLINLLITPLCSLLLAIPDTFASIACLHRIQDFLSQPTRCDMRQFPQFVPTQTTSSTNLPSIELSRLPQPGSSTPPENQRDIIISMNNVNFGWKASPPDRAGITLTLESTPTGNLVTIVGPVGSGKSTFLKGLAGETPVVQGNLFIKYPHLAFCEQTPWLTNGTIRDNIIGERPLSTLDGEWYSTVVKACGLDLDLKRMPAGDETLVGSNGAKLSGGQKQRVAIARAVFARKQIACFDDPLSGLDNATAQLVFNNILGPTGFLRQMGCTVFLATNSTNYLSHADVIIVLGDNGQVLEQGSYPQLQNHAGGYIYGLETQSKLIDEAERSVEGDNDRWEPPETTAGPPSTLSPHGSHRQTTDLSVYKYYFSSLGWLRVTVLLFFLVVDTGINGLRYIWVELWSSSTAGALGSRLSYWLGLYGALAVIEASALALAVFWTWVIIVPAASKNLHHTVLRACMSAPFYFLSNVGTGNLITRFSQDMRLVDMILPRGFISTGFQLFGALSQGAIAIASLPYLAAAMPVLLAVLVMVQRSYLRTSRQLRLLEIELKTPLYTHFIESLTGIITIRAFAWTEISTTRMLSMLDTAQKPFYLLLCIQRWLELVLNLIVAALAVILISAAVALRSHVNPGLLGIALVMMIDLGQILSDLIQYWTLLETSLGAIARIKEFAEDTPSEDINTNIQTHEPLMEWPSRGDIAFIDVSVGYCSSEESIPVVNDVHLHIRAGEKIGLCGRTGSGKSTLALSLLRLSELVSGQILIDGQDITLISRSSMRQRISCLSQETFLFPGTIRQNADPLNNMTNTEIIDALRCVDLWDSLVSNYAGNEKAVLDAKLNDTILSQGQKQLFCLARALLKKSKILILDEPTSSLDTETDAKVQMVIRKSFRECTVIMVAHRIHTLLDFDRVAILDRGRIVELGEPRELMHRPDGQFSKRLDLES